jgi:dihydroorotate dehydrogenase
MTPSIASALLPLLHRLDAERAHEIALQALRFGLAGAAREYDDPILAVTALGLRFGNPIGHALRFAKKAAGVPAPSRRGTR